MSPHIPYPHPLRRGWFFLILLLMSIGSIPISGWTQDSLTLPVSTDPFKAAERQNATRQSLAEQRVSIEQLQHEIAQLTAEQSAKLQTLSLSSETVSVAQVEQSRLDSDTFRLKQEELQTGIDGAKRQIKDLQQTISTLEAQEQLLKNPAKDSSEISNRTEQLARLSTTLDQYRIDLDLEQQDLKNQEEWLALLNQRRTLATQWRARLEEIYLQQQAQQRQEALRQGRFVESGGHGARLSGARPGPLRDSRTRHQSAWRNASTSWLRSVRSCPCTLSSTTRPPGRS